MDDVAARIIEREEALAEFDHAREDFERAWSKVPDEALDYKPVGDDYSIRDLLSHMSGVMEMYMRTLKKIREAEYEEVRLVAGTPESEPHYGDRLKVRAGRAVRLEDRTGLLDELEANHDRLAAMLRERVEEEFGRQAPVYYVGSEEPYPTSGRDILGWVTNHYREHIAHVAELLERWEKERKM
jgi:uncharacterized damage-inducible protein DinB